MMMRGSEKSWPQLTLTGCTRISIRSTKILIWWGTPGTCTTSSCVSAFATVDESVKATRNPSFATAKMNVAYSISLSNLNIDSSREYPGRWLSRSAANYNDLESNQSSPLTHIARWCPSSARQAKESTSCSRKEQITILWAGLTILNKPNKMLSTERDNSQMQALEHWSLHTGDSTRTPTSSSNNSTMVTWRSERMTCRRTTINLSRTWHSWA